jgi:iron donor protein CyaY
MNFSQHYDSTIRNLEEKLSDLIDTGAAFDMERKGDVLDIEFEDGEKIVITPQAPLEQLWVSADYAGHRFIWNDGWKNEKDGASIEEFLNTILLRRLGKTL